MNITSTSTSSMTARETYLAMNTTSTSTSTTSVTARETYQELIWALDQIETASALGKKFVPEDRFNSVFTIELLHQIVGDLLGEVQAGGDVRQHVPQLYRRHRKTIAILVWMARESYFVRFWQMGLTDLHLPLTQQKLQELHTQVWWPRFNELQYKFLARGFGADDDDGGGGRAAPQWSDDYVLPIVAKKWRSNGGFSTVFRIKIHPCYDFLNYSYEDDGDDSEDDGCGRNSGRDGGRDRDHEIGDSRDNDNGGEDCGQHWYALKQLKHSDNAAVAQRKVREFHDEVAANSLVRQQHHANILPLLHSHTYGATCNLIFPLASYNLTEFYEAAPAPAPWHEDPAPRLRFVEQISRLVPALGALHQGKIDSKSRWVGSHRDLKPANILVLGRGVRRRFMISDLGLMRFREIGGTGPGPGHDYTAAADDSRGMSAYRAPECDEPGRKVGRGADIWSMGCILAEALSWAVGGPAAITRFTEARRTTNAAGYTDSWFFSSSSGSSSGSSSDARGGGRRGGGTCATAPGLKAEVRAWFAELRTMSRDSAGKPDPLLCDALNMVESMLRDTPRGAKGRPTAEKLDCDLYALLRAEAERADLPLHVSEPNYYLAHQQPPARLALPFSYSRSASLMDGASQQQPLHSPLHSPARLTLPFSYSRSTSFMDGASQQPLHSPLHSPLQAPPQLTQQLAQQQGMSHPRRQKRRRSEDTTASPSQPTSSAGLASMVSGLSTLSQGPTKRRRNLPAFVHLKRLDTMFLVDDYVADSPTRWAQLRASIRPLAAIATEWDQDGVDLAFVHRTAYYPCLATSGRVLAAFDAAGPAPAPASSLQLRLDDLLHDYVSRFRDDQFLKPLNLIVLTHRGDAGDDGESGGGDASEDRFEETVMMWARELDIMRAPRSQLGLQFVLVGSGSGRANANANANVRRFTTLDEEMWKQYGVRDMVDATCYDPDAPVDSKLLEKIMCGGMIRTFDRLDENELEEWEEMLGVSDGDGDGDSDA